MDLKLSLLSGIPLSLLTIAIMTAAVGSSTLYRTSEPCDSVEGSGVPSESSGLLRLAISSASLKFLLPVSILFNLERFISMHPNHKDLQRQSFLKKLVLPSSLNFFD